MIDNLRALAAAIQGRSLTAAAERLCVTQSAVSRRLQHLEDVLGASLFDRTQRPPVPNALGRRIYEQALPILEAVDALMALPREDAPPSGTLSLGVTPAIGDTLSSGMVGRIKREFPALDIRLRTDWGSSLTQQVLNGELDAAFVIRPQGDEVIAPLDGRRIATLELVVVETRTAPRRSGSLTLSSLAEEDWILNPIGCGYRSSLEAAMGARGRRIRVAVDVYGTEIQLRMIASGMGFGLVPRSILNTSPIQSDVKFVEIEDFSMKLDVHMISRGHLGNMKRPSNSFADELAASLSAPFAVTDGQA